MLKGTSGKKTTDSVIHLIDRRVANLRESIRVLHSQRNGLLSISKVPAEILTEIFLLHQQNVTENYTVETVDWIGVTHVSQQWREIALNFSRLWIHIPFYHPKWAEEMITRAQHAYLIVRATYAGQLLKSFLQKHLPRVQVLEVQNASPQLFQDIQPTSVPCMSTLSLLMPWQEPVTGPSPLQIVDSRLLNTTLLKKVEVSTTLGWDSMLLSGLTHLRLGNGRNVPRTQTSQREFLDALRRMPNLQCLDLKRPALPEKVDRSLLEPVYLPDLQDLSVFDTVHTIEFFLHHVTFPPTTRIAIGCKHPDIIFRHASISPVLVPIKQLLSDRSHTLKIHRIEFTCFYDDWEMINLRFKGWVSSGPSSLEPEGYTSNFSSDNPDFTFFVQWNWRVVGVPSYIGEVIAGVFGIFPQDDVVSLSLSSHNLHDTLLTPFSRKIGQLPALNALFLNHISSTQNLLDLDCDVPQERVNPSMATYPALLYLDLSNCGSSIGTPALKTLYNCLKKRSECGLGPRKLRVDLRGVQQVDEEATALVEKVVEVIWLMDSADSETQISASD
jgi:hypothetical protein